MAELLDAYDRNFNIIENATLIRGEKIPEGMFRMVGEIIVKHVDGTFLMMQRDFAKFLGGKWELTASGHVQKGETPYECAVRELEEETGIRAVNMREIKKVGEFEYQVLFTIHFCLTDCDKNAVKLQKGETIAFKWVDKETLFKMDLDEFASPASLDFIREFDL